MEANDVSSEDMDESRNLILISKNSVVYVVCSCLDNSYYPSITLIGSSWCFKSTGLTPQVLIIQLQDTWAINKVSDNNKNIELLFIHLS